MMEPVLFQPRGDIRTASVAEQRRVPIFRGRDNMAAGSVMKITGGGARGP